jgi:hypothetical protein
VCDRIMRYAFEIGSQFGRYHFGGYLPEGVYLSPSERGGFSDPAMRFIFSSTASYVSA